jgi:pseudaminic acid synthase
MKSIRIGNSDITDVSGIFIIAELSCNHLQDFSLAVKTIHAMKEAGADCVKLQTVRPGSITIDCNKTDFLIKGGTLWDGKTLFELYQETYTPWEWHEPIKKLVEDLGMEFFSSPFDNEAVDFLETLNVPAYKIASFEITDIPLIKYAAAKGKPMIISTGIAEESDIQDAVEACHAVGNYDVILLKCTSAYPTPYEEVNLNMIPTLRSKFGCFIGLSDHTFGSTVPMGAVALGAKVIEKHFILGRELGGPDAGFSMEPHEFKAMVDSVRELEKALGKPEIQISDKIRKSRDFARSLYVVEDVKKGEFFTIENVRSIRPGFGMKPKYLSDILGKKAGKDIERGTAMSEDLIQLR